jgi:hypothetical protein
LYDHAARVILQVLSALATAMVFISWIGAVISNPEATASDSGTGYTVCTKMKRETRYCQECKKLVYEFDHHCLFLNNCVGSKNYNLFIVLLASASIQTVEYIITCIIFHLYHDVFERLK